MKEKLTAQFIVVLTATAAAWLGAVADTYDWQSDGTGYDGSFTSTAHWGGVAVPGETSAQAGDIAKFARGVGSYTVTFPSGALDNYSIGQLRVGQGETVRFDGRETTLTFPTGAYNTFLVSGAKPNGDEVTFLGVNGMSGMAFSNFDMSLSSDSSGNNTLTLNGGTYTFTGQLYPFAYGTSTTYKGDTGGTYSSGTATFAMTNVTLTTSNWNLGSVAPTNRLVVSGGCVNAGSVYYEYWVPNQPNDVNVLKEFVFTGGAYVRHASGWSLGFDKPNRLNSRNHTLRVRVEDGAEWQVHSINSGLGRMEILVSGEGSFIKPFSNTSSLGCVDGGTAYMEISDGAAADLQRSIILGSATYPSTSWGELVVANAVVTNRLGLVLSNGRIAVNDGGVLVLAGELATYNVRGDGNGGTREVICDGGTIRLISNVIADPITDVPAVQLGPKGLLIEGKTYSEKTLSAKYTDKTTGGRLVLKPYYDRENFQRPMTLSSADSDESYLDIAQGTVKLAAGANHNSFLTVTNNAVFTLAGDGLATSATLKGLKLGDGVTGGTLELDATDVVTLSGPFDIANGSVKLSSTLGEGSHTLFVMTTEPSESLKAFWGSSAKASFTSGLDTTKYNIFTVEEAAGAWNFVITVYSSIPAKAGDATWQGGGSAWETAANWQDGQLPDGTHGAVFAGASPTAVELAGDVTSAGLTFDAASGYSISGGKVNLAFSDGSHIGVSNGTHVVSSGVDNPYTTTKVAVEAGASLTLSGPFSGVGIDKTGDGALELTSSNAMSDGITLREGTLKATPAALNVGGSAVVSTLAGGTLELTGAGAATPNVNVAGAVTLVANGGNQSMSAPSASSGSSLAKRGTGAFTLAVDRDRAMSSTPIYVYEGALRMDGDGVHEISGVGTVGIYSRGLSAADAPDAGLVVNNVKKLAVGNLNLGYGCEGDYVSYAPYLAVTNSYLSAAAVYSGDNSDAFVCPQASFSNATLQVTGSGGFCPGGSLSAQLLTNKWFFTDSRLELGYVFDSRRFFTYRAPYEMTFDHSTLCYCTNGVEGSIEMSVRSGWGTDHGTFTFKNGSVLRCQRILYLNDEEAASSNPRFNFTFEDSEWFVADADMDVPSKGINVNIAAAGETGIIFAPPAERTWTLYTTVTGEGGFTKRGAGTLSVVAARKCKQPLEDTRTIQCTGALRVEGGLLQIADGTIDNISGREVVLANDGVLDYGGMTLANAVVATAGGTIRNATLTQPTFVVGFDGEGAALPVGLDYANGLTVSGRVVFDFGVETGKPWAWGTVMTVARWTGAQKPDVSRWRAENVGDGCSCVFAANNDGTITATVINKRGFLLIYR